MSRSRVSTRPSAPRILLKVGVLLVTALPLLYGCDARSGTGASLAALLAHASELGAASAFPMADLAITHTAASYLSLPEPLAFTVVVTNNGEATASDVHATIGVPGTAVVGSPHV